VYVPGGAIKCELLPLCDEQVILIGLIDSVGVTRSSDTMLLLLSTSIKKPLIIPWLISVPSASELKKTTLPISTESEVAVHVMFVPRPWQVKIISSFPTQAWLRLIKFPGGYNLCISAVPV
jgi:hypothetical protein